MPPRKRKHTPARIQIENVAPTIDSGRYVAKRTVGDSVPVSATIFRDGHEVLRAVVQYRHADDKTPKEATLKRIDADVAGDTWAGEFPVDRVGDWEFSIQAWTDPWAAWRHEIERKVAVNQLDLSGELSEGVLLIDAAAKKIRKAADKKVLTNAVAILKDDEATQAAKIDEALKHTVDELVSANQARAEIADQATPTKLWIDRPRARFGAWYELFPRSWGGFKGVTEQLPKLKELGFDVLYMPPIHPIGTSNRKGRNNSLTAAESDPGSPYAIGDATGGHEAFHPELGSAKDFANLVKAAKQLDIDIALDLAINCSPDHPWLKQHPEWFEQRPDGTLKYAENPPKKYQDIYNVNWNCEDWEGLWEALYGVVKTWVDRGVKIFRVDNPHTKPLPFWEWLINRIRAEDPDVIFLAEAFTRAAMMRTLAKLGFSQSYTYFTWKNSRHELTEYVNELAHSEMAEYYRPNFFTNTPDILHEYLVHGGPPAFAIRAVLATTLSPSYGIYSGYEHFENVPVKEGSEEYLDSEKYELKERRLDGPLLPFISTLNRARQENPALQYLENITFLDTQNDALIAYAKRTAGNTIICVVTIDPRWPQEGGCVVPYELGLPPAFTVEDLLTGERFDWRLGRNYVRLDPPFRVAHVLKVG